MREWFVRAVPDPQDRNRQTQLGVHVEEVGEMAEALLGQGQDKLTDRHIANFSDQALIVSQGLKEGLYKIDWDKVDRTPLLDALCDQIVTAVGLATFLGMDIVGAMREVDSSNWSKFDEGGNPLLDPETQKIVKGPRYRPASLDNFA